MKSIWKFTLEPGVAIDMPVGAEILDIQVQHGEPQLWAIVDTNAETEMRCFAIYGTGHVIPDDSGKDIGTFQVQGGSFVFHVFEQ